jgi:hypothetical protein
MDARSKAGTGSLFFTGDEMMWIFRINSGMEKIEDNTATLADMTGSG